MRKTAAIWAAIVVIFAQSAVAASIGELLEQDSEFSIFVKALKKCSLWGRLAEGGSVTVFAPTDAAMRQEGSDFLLGTVLMTKWNEQRLSDLMSFHMTFNMRLDPESFDDAVALDTHAESCLRVRRIGTRIRVGPEAFVTRHLPADNGIVYVIDRLLWQPWQGDRRCDGSAIENSDVASDRRLSAAP
jgi:uncharacterized surface protein with fasciclin (FAS1) repeats